MVSMLSGSTNSGRTKRSNPLWLPSHALRQWKPFLRRSCVSVSVVVVTRLVVVVRRGAPVVVGDSFRVGLVVVVVRDGGWV